MAVFYERFKDSRRVTVVAFHGSTFFWTNGANRMRRDMGDPNYVSHYYREHNIPDFLAEFATEERLFLIGYSKGGDFIARLTHYLDNIVGVVLYESPVLHDGGVCMDYTTDDFPVWMFWNESSRQAKTQAAGHSISEWSKSRTRFTLEMKMQGRGHVDWFSFPPGHAWDRRVTALIPSMIESLDLSERVTELL